LLKLKADKVNTPGLGPGGRRFESCLPDNH
jgi:hypothetical protein